MSTRHLFSIIVGVACLSSLGCCCGPIGCGCGLGGRVFNDCCPGCGCPEPSCCCEPACGCCDACTGPSCGCCDACCEPVCGCADCCCEPSCGCDVGCGTPVGCCCPILGNCCIIQRLRQAFCGGCCGGCGGGCGCFGGCAGCSSEPYWSEWHNDPPRGGGSCNCHGASASTGGRYGNSYYARRANMMRQNVSQELRFADQGGDTTYK